ncbi:MAG: hypothetical protein U0804_03635 [Gemmataceae bacterium]
MTRPRVAPWLVALAVGLAGCTSDNRPAGDGNPTRADELREVGGIAAAHAAKGKKAAPTAAELAAYEATFPVGVRALKAGDVTAVWGVKPAEEGAVAAGQAAGGVLAYEKKAETEGGSVLLQDGTVRTMTADEFRAAPKAK